MTICCRNNTTLNLCPHWFINCHRLIYLVMINNFGMCFYTHRFRDTVCTWAHHGTVHAWRMIYIFHNCDLLYYFYIFCLTIFHTCNRRISKQGTSQQYKKHFFHNNTFICFYSPTPGFAQNYINPKSKVYQKKYKNKKTAHNGRFFSVILCEPFLVCSHCVEYVLYL